MQFNLKESKDILRRTPVILELLLSDLNNHWINSNEGDNTWTAYDVVGHLIFGEKTDWIPRMKIILGDGVDKRFIPFDRFAQFQESKGKTLPELLGEFKTLRTENLRFLETIEFSDRLLEKKGIHPELGEVTLRQLLSTWVVHDLAHLTQITRVMAKQYRAEIGPWVKYFSLFNK